MSGSRQTGFEFTELNFIFETLFSQFFAGFFLMLLMLKQMYFVFKKQVKSGNLGSDPLMELAF